jgi:hypothetical protein
LQDDKIFIPIAPLRRGDGQVTLLFLVTNVAYVHPVDDPLFYADSSIEGGGFKLYATSEAAHVLGCVETYELCNGGNCTQFAAPSSFHKKDLDDLGFNKKQWSTAVRILGAMKATTIHEMNYATQGLDLLANRYVYGLSVHSLPSDQWIQEVNHWFGTMMNLIQIQSLSFLTGPNDPSNEKNVMDIPEKDRWMCGSQIIRRDDYASFNVLGMVIILAVGGFFFLFSLFLTTITKMISHLCVLAGRRRHEEEGKEEWQEYGVLQMQQRILQVQGVAQWEGLDADVPVVAKGSSSIVTTRKSSLSAAGRSGRCQA